MTPTAADASAHRVKESDVGWYAARGAFVLPGGREVGFRATGVCRREDGEWRILQSHTSIPVSKEEALGD